MITRSQVRHVLRHHLRHLVRLMARRKCHPRMRNAIKESLEKWS